MPSPAITIEQSGAFVEAFIVEATASGPLDGLTFAVKDLIDVAGHKTGCGNPTWKETHPPARSHAFCVEQLLASGARCVGKTITDEVAFSLLGENHFYGTPLNPKAPNRIPGGSSNGSASAVACGLADFALGTDTGGSIRFPANNCGVWGLRPSHGFISVAGVMPFAPGFDTVGVLARDAEVLSRAAEVLLGIGQSQPAATKSLYLIKEAFAFADDACRASLVAPIEQLRQTFGVLPKEISLAEIIGEPWAADFNHWRDTYCVLQWAEIENSLGPWIADCHPQFGPGTLASFKLVDTLDRRRIVESTVHRETIHRKLRAFLGPHDLLCMPTAPTPAPLKGNIELIRTGDYYRRSLAMTSIAGLGRLPQISMPLAEVEGAPYGLSLLAGFGNDAFLLSAARSLTNS
jgi:amidase